MGNILQIKVTLKGSKPPIWRRVQIADTSSFADLHDVIRDAMGWDGSHLHGFAFEQKKSKPPILIGPPSSDSMLDSLPERRELVVNWLGKKAEQCLYTYDYGDDWDHVVLLEKILPADPNATYPCCIEGKRACPPDDCGGLWGYYDKLEVLKDSNNPEYEETLEWMGEDFDPDAFDPTAVEFLGAVELFSPWEVEDEGEDNEDNLSLDIDNMEDALHELDHPGPKVSFEAIEFMRASELHKQVVDHIVFVLDNAYDQRSIQLDIFHDTSPLWYAIVAEGHLDERLIEPTIRLVTTTDDDWELLSEQANRLICLLAEKFPDKTSRAVVDAIDQALRQKAQTPYLYLFDVFIVMGVEKHRDWLRKLAKHPDNSWADSVKQLLERAGLNNAEELKDGVKEDWRIRYAGFKRDLVDAQDDDVRFVSNLPYIAPPKVGRNEPCPCGSGKKYKKCHGLGL